MLFERAGYRITRLGIEELFHEVVHLEAAQYGPWPDYAFVYRRPRSARRA
jgi:hypothetical protein